MSTDLTEDQLGPSMHVLAFRAWLTTTLREQALKIQEQKSESLPKVSDSVFVNTTNDLLRLSVSIFLDHLLDEEFPVDITPTPEEKAAKKLAKQKAKEEAKAQELAEKKEKIAKLKEEHPEWGDFKVGVPHHGCFGYLNGHLILGTRHHQAIMAMLIDKGWTWTDLFQATQVWGWYTINAADIESPWFDPEVHWVEPSVNVSFVSDAAIMNAEAAEGCIQAFKDTLGIEKVTGGEFMEDRDVRRHGREYGGDFDNHYKGPDGELVLPNGPVVYEDVTPIPPPPVSLEKELVPA